MKQLRRFTTLQLALGASFAVHAALLTVRFVDPERFNRVFQDTPLEVILVNARTNDTPDKAQALAQASMGGGGEADKGRATTPLPASALVSVGDSLEEQTSSSTQTLFKLLAEIERRIKEENARPKKRYVSPATREVAYAVYYDTMRRLIEDMGTTNFPTAGGKKLYGELTMLITVNHDGQVLATEVVDSSGIALLDRRAEMIARSKFTRDELLEAKVGGK